MNKEIKQKYGHLPVKVAIQNFIMDNKYKKVNVSETKDKLVEEFQLTETQAENLSKYYYYHAN